MIQVSNRFKDKIYAPIRKTTAKVIFEILDNDAYKDNEISLPNQSIISRGNQLNNKLRNMTHKYATFEPDYFKLDGSFYIPPNQSEDNSELGYWSEDLSDENGYFVPDQVIEINLAHLHNSVGLTISFDVLANEYATEFDIEVYGSSLIHLEQVIDNQDPLYVLEKTLGNYNRIVITIKKWCKPNRRARVVEVDYGLIKEYKDDILIGLNVLEEMDIVGSIVPSNELVFTVDNSDRRFNILNPQGYHKYLQEYQEVSGEVGLQVDEESEDYEYISMGKYYLIDWQSDEGALTTTFTARDIFEVLETIEYSESLTGTNLYDLAEDILIKSGVENYVIDNRLKQTTTNGFIEPLSVRMALQSIGIAGQCVVYQDRYGVLRIRHIETLSKSTGYLYFAGMDSYSGVTVPAVDESYDMKYIDFDNMYNEPEIKLDRLIKSVTVHIFDGSDFGLSLTINNPSVTNNRGNALKIYNELINTQNHAEEVANWIVREKNLRVLYNINWRQNPALECGDAVLVEDSFGAKQRSRIIKQEFIFDGALRGNTKTKGGV